MHRSRQYGLIGLVMAALAAGCGDGGGEPRDPVETTISVSPAGPLNVTAGTSQTLTATVLDQHGRPMTGQTINWSSSHPTVIVSPSGETATVTGSIASTGTITATTAEVASAPVTVSIVAGPAFGLEKVLDLPANTVAGTGDIIRVRVVDAFGNAVAGAAVTFAVTGGGGFVDVAPVTSNAQGIAQTQWTTGTTVGANTATASAGPGLTIGFSVSTVAGPPASVSVTSAQVVVIDVGMTFVPTWVVRDANGNIVPDAALSFAGRGTAVEVTSDGTVRGAIAGQGRVVARSATHPVGDSILVVVGNLGAPVVRTDLASIGLKADTVFTVGIFVDMRSATNKLGSATLRVDWLPTQLTYLSNEDGAAGVAATVNSTLAPEGTLRMSLASPNSTGWSGLVEVRRITFRATPVTRVTGSLVITTSEIATTDFVDLLSTTVAVSHPLKTR